MTRQVARAAADSGTVLLLGAACITRSLQSVKMMYMYYTGTLQNQH